MEGIGNLIKGIGVFFVGLHLFITALKQAAGHQLRLGSPYFNRPRSD